MWTERLQTEIKESDIKSILHNYAPILGSRVPSFIVSRIQNIGHCMIFPLTPMLKFATKVPKLPIAKKTNRPVVLSLIPIFAQYIYFYSGLQHCERNYGSRVPSGRSVC